MACTGIEFCKLAIVETKQRAADLIAELEQRFPDLDTPITVNVNGCPNACARTQVADIGLKGQLVLDADGHQVEGFQVHLGGGARARRRSSARSCGPTRSPAPASTTTSPTWSRAFLDAARTTASPSRPGSAAPTTTRCAARSAPRAGGVSMSGGRGIPFHCPYCGDENLRPSEERPRRLGVPRLPARLLAQDARHDPRRPSDHATEVPR